MDAISPGMVVWKLRNTETGVELQYEANDLQCAQMLAAEDGGGEPEDWLVNHCDPRRGDDEI